MRWQFVYYINNLITGRDKQNPSGQGGFHNLLQHSVKPLILPDNFYILRLARGHVLIKAIEH